MKDDRVIPTWQRIICGIFAILGVWSFYMNPPELSQFTWSNAFPIFKFLAAVVGCVGFAYFAVVGKIPKRFVRKNENT